MADMVGKHFRYVEAHIDVLPAHPREKPARDIRVAPLLVPLHRLGGRTELFGKAGFDLAKNDRIPVRRHDVRLAEGGAVVRFQNFVPEGFKVFCSSSLSALSQNFFVNVLR